MLVRLRDQYWILGAMVKRHCVPYQLQDSVGAVQSPPFSVVEIDHGEPLYSSDFPRTNFSILLFTCAVIHTIYLKLVASVCCEMLLTITRFHCPTGLSSVVLCSSYTSVDQMVQNGGPLLHDRDGGWVGGSCA